MRDFTQQRFSFIDFYCFLPAEDNPLHSLVWALTRLGEMNNKSYLHSLVWARAALNSPCTSHHSPLYFLTAFRLPYFLTFKDFLSQLPEVQWQAKRNLWVGQNCFYLKFYPRFFSLKPRNTPVGMTVVY